ncbi:MAG: tail fiber protein [Pseudomonadota bacterium]
MPEPFVGEIRMFAGNLAPEGWAFCHGQLLDTSQNETLFSLIGTTYGGDGRATFGLPDLRGHAPIHEGWGAGLSRRAAGQKGGAEDVTLNVSELPAHNHTLGSANIPGTDGTPSGVFGRDSVGSKIYGTELTNTTAELSPAMVGHVGGSRSHPNMMPYLAINFIIALFGDYPNRV